MTPGISCIIYDMDGLLLDTEGIYTEVTQEIVAEYGKVFDWSIKKKIIGRRSIQAAQIIVESLDFIFHFTFISHSFLISLIFISLFIY